MPVRSADATWEGSVTQGQGTIHLGSGAFEGQYNFTSRFEEGVTGTNPEELIGGAQAACFSMALSANLGQAGHSPTRISTTADVHINKTDSGWAIPRIELRTEAEVEGITDEDFQQIAESTKRTCPVSQLLTGAQITLEAKLAG